MKGLVEKHLRYTGSTVALAISGRLGDASQTLREGVPRTSTSAR